MAMRKTIFLFLYLLFLLPCTFSQSQLKLNFKEVWNIFNTAFSSVDSLLYEKGYTVKKQGNLSVNFSKTEQDNLGKIEISHTWYDSAMVSGVSFVLVKDEILLFASNLTANGFRPETLSDSLTSSNYKQQGVSQLESVRYFLFCSIMRNYPQTGQYMVRFIWHDLIRQSIAVIKKGNNPYLTNEAEAEFQTMSFTPYDTVSLFQPVEEKPVFKGDRRGIYIYLNSNVNYPEAALKDSIEASMTVQYKIDEQGKVVAAEVVKGKEAGHGLPEEAVRLFLSMPSWRPGKQNGKIISSLGKQIVVFKIRP
jgi:Gram-negative bacterial TonB protein C-terminal